MNDGLLFFALMLVAGAFVAGAYLISGRITLMADSLTVALADIASDLGLITTSLTTIASNLAANPNIPAADAAELTSQAAALDGVVTTLNGLVTADAVLVPLQCEFFALEGISQIMRTIDVVRRGLNPGLRLQGIVLTMFDRRNNLSDLVAADARGFFGNQVYETVIPRNIRVSEAPSHGKPVILYDARSPGAQAYVRLASELLERERRPGRAA